MNVIISNKYSATLQDLNIDIIKSETGVFSADEIVAKYQNFFFQRMILDITALQDYQDIKNLQKLSISLDMDKLILLFDDTEETSRPEFLSQLISIGIYNFTKNVEGVMYLFNNPNTYRDVAQYHQIDLAQELTEQNLNNSYSESRGVRIIGVKDVTKSAGATSLIYMMRNLLMKNYDVIAVEVDKTDFVYFNDKRLITTNSQNVGNILARNSDKEVILVDVNKSTSALSGAQDVLYLVEPTTIKLNRLMMIDPDILGTLHNKKIVLNQSLLTSKDVLDFEYESKTKVFFNLPPLNERNGDIVPLTQMLIKLGFGRLNENDPNKKKGLFG